MTKLLFAISCLVTALGLWAGYVYLRRSSEEKALRAARAAAARGELSLAEAALGQLADDGIFPNNVRARLALASVRLAQGDKAKARALACQLPDDPAADVLRQLIELPPVTEGGWLDAYLHAWRAAGGRDLRESWLLYDDVDGIDPTRPIDLEQARPVLSRDDAFLVAYADAIRDQNFVGDVDGSVPPPDALLRDAEALIGSTDDVVVRLVALSVLSSPTLPGSEQTRLRPVVVGTWRSLRDAEPENAYFALHAFLSATTAFTPVELAQLEEVCRSTTRYDWKLSETYTVAKRALSLVDAPQAPDAAWSVATSAGTPPFLGLQARAEDTLRSEPQQARRLGELFLCLGERAATSSVLLDINVAARLFERAAEWTGDDTVAARRDAQVSLASGIVSRWSGPSPLLLEHWPIASLRREVHDRIAADELGFFARLDEGTLAQGPAR